jgi:hypothetical protein
MKCCISGLETENKYKNQPIHPDVIELAKDIQLDNPKYSMDRCLKLVAKNLINDIDNRLNNGEVPHE